MPVAEPNESFESLLERFEEEWYESECADVAAYFDQAQRLTGAENLSWLAEIDLEFRWGRYEEDSDLGELDKYDFPLFSTAEDYRKLVIDIDDAMSQELYVHEFRARLRWGDRPTMAEYVERCPNKLERLELIDQTTQRARSFSGDRKELGNFELVEEIGEGAMGRVWLARDCTLGRPVALKLVSSVRGTPELFEREAKAMASVESPFVVQVLSAGQEDGQRFLVMEYLPEGNLRKRRSELAGDARRAVSLIRDVAKGVQAIHEAGVVHRDLKPENVMITRSGRPKITDFGLARFAEVTSKTTLTGGLAGTVLYMPPEQLIRKGDEVGTGTDVWALGVMLFELVAQRMPFAGSDFNQLVNEIKSAEVDYRTSDGAPLDDGLRTIIGKCLEKRPGDRFRSAMDLAAELDRWLDGQELRTRSTWGSRVSQRVRRHSKAIIAMSGIALVMLGAMALVRSGDLDWTAWAIERELAAGKTVTMIGDSGTLRWHERGADVSFHVTDGQPLRITSGFESLIFLARDTQMERYTISGEFRQEDAFGNFARFGLFALYTSGENDAGHPEESMIVLSFNDYDLEGKNAEGEALEILKARGNYVHFLPTSRVLDPAKVNSPSRRSGAFTRPISRQPRSREWIHLKLVVDPNMVSAYIDGELAGEASVDEISDALFDLSPYCPRPNVRCPIGIYLCNSKVAIRNVVIEPFERRAP